MENDKNSNDGHDLKEVESKRSADAEATKRRAGNHDHNNDNADSVAATTGDQQHRPKEEQEEEEEVGTKHCNGDRKEEQGDSTTPTTRTSMAATTAATIIEGEDEDTTVTTTRSTAAASTDDGKTQVWQAQHPGAVAVPGPSTQPPPAAELAELSTGAMAAEAQSSSKAHGSNNTNDSIVEVAAMQMVSVSLAPDDNQQNSASSSRTASAQEPQNEQPPQENNNVQQQPRQSTAPHSVSFSLPVAQEYHEAPLISSAMVVIEEEPVVATPAHPPHPALRPSPNTVVYHVDFDEEADTGEELNMHKSHVKRQRRWVILGMAGLVFIVVAIIVGVVVMRKGKDDDDDDDGNGGSNGNNSTLTTTSTNEDYPCFTSTLDLMTAQIENTSQNIFIVCPNTWIPMGTFRNPSREDYNFTGGDYVLSVLRPNITIQCGLNGLRSNNCTLAGGLSHIVTQSIIYHPIYGYQTVTEPIDNMLIKGLTFTGKTQSSGVFGGIPVALSHPGRNIRFEDCAWKDLTATKRVFFVGTNYLMELQDRSIPALSVDVTLSHCVFDNIIYETEFMVSHQQSLHIEATTFRNIQLPPLYSQEDEGCELHPKGCRNLLHCRSTGSAISYRRLDSTTTTTDDNNSTTTTIHSICSIADICVENFDIAGAAPIVVSQDTQWTSSGVNTWQGPVEIGSSLIITPDTDTTSMFFNINQTTTATANDSSPPFCALGVARVDETGLGYHCLDQPVFVPPSTTGRCSNNQLP